MRAVTMMFGLLLLGMGAVFEGIQTGPANPSVVAKPGSTVNTASAAVNPPTTGATQPTGVVDFSTDQRDLDLQLAPDQTVSTWVRVVVTKRAAQADQTGKTAKTATNKKVPKKGETKTKKGATKNGSGIDGAAAPNNTTVNQDGTNEDVSASVSFYLDMDGSRDVGPCTKTVAPTIGDTVLKGAGLHGIPITITSCKPDGGVGKLVIVGGGRNAKRKVTLRQRKSNTLFGAIVISLTLALVICLSCAVIVSGQGHKMGDTIGQASWDFSSSWASNITVFGTAFTFLVTLVFPDKPFFATRGEYGFVAGFASALAALAPAVNRLMSPTTPDSSTGNSTPSTVLSPEGFVGSFLTASAFTIWGALLQIAVELLVLCELARTVTIYDLIGTIVTISVAITAVALILYSWRTILSTIAANAERTGKPTAKLRAAFTLAAPDRPTAKRRRVSVL